MNLQAKWWQKEHRPLGRMSGRCLLALFAALASLGPQSAHAELGQDAASRSPVRRLDSSGNALVRLAEAVADLNVGEPSLVAVTPVGVGPELAPRTNENALENLRQKIRQTVAAAVPLSGRRIEEALSPEQARRAARVARLPLVLLSPEVKDGDLLLTVTVTKWSRMFWQRTVSPEGTTTETLTFRISADSLRRLFPAAKQTPALKSRSKSPIASPTAMACGNMNSDGSRDIALVGRGAIALGSWTAHGFSTSKTKPWSALVPVHGAPLRAPLGAAHIRDGQLIVGLSDRAAMVYLNTDLDVVGYSRRAYPLPDGRCLPFTETGLQETPVTCDQITKVPPSPDLGALEASKDDLSAFSENRFITSSGVPGRATAKLSTSTSVATLRLELPSEQTQEIEIPSVGTVLQTLDLDGDGTIEVLASTDSSPTTADSLRILTHEGGQLRLVQEQSAPAITAVAVCPFDGTNPLSLVVATEDELWLLQ